MDGTTLCPHCETRFKIAVSQLEAHQGMARCGHCLQAFDARINFIPDTPSPQLELTMLEVQAAEIDEALVEQTTDISKPLAPEVQHDNLDFMAHLSATNEGEKTIPNIGLANEKDVNSVESVMPENAENSAVPKPQRAWLWATLLALMVLLAIGQVAYFFRADFAARIPVTKPLLLKYCELLSCTVSLPQKNDLMSIESSSLEADPNNSTQITLSALLRNRAPYSLAFPNLELTLNDRQDKPVARRIFKPADYLPSTESEQIGLQANHELNLKLLLDTTDLYPNGYRLVVLYPTTR